MNEALHSRARLVRERALVRSWEFRQRHHSKGVWHRLRRVLVDAEEAWLIDDSDADRIESRGRVPIPVGRELSPQKRLFFVSRDELAALPSRSRTPVRLSAELLHARSVALVPFADLPSPHLA